MPSRSKEQAVASHNEIKSVFLQFIASLSVKAPDETIDYYLKGGTALELHRIIEQNSSPDIDIDIYIPEKLTKADKELYGEYIQDILKGFIESLPASTFEGFEETEEEARARATIENTFLVDRRVLITYAKDPRYKQIAVSLRLKGIQMHILEINLLSTKGQIASSALIAQSEVFITYTLDELLNGNLKALDFNIQLYKENKLRYNLTGQDKEAMEYFAMKLTNNLYRLLRILEVTTPENNSSRLSRYARKTPGQSEAQFQVTLAQMNRAHNEMSRRKSVEYEKARKKFLEILKGPPIEPIGDFIAVPANRRLIERAVPTIKFKET